jgi:hypothetical protein
VLRLSLRLLALVALVNIAGLTSAADKEEFRPLFDGKSLDGWVQRGGKAKYEVKDGEIVGTSVLGTPNSFLCTDRDYGDFILEVEFKVHPGMNSGIQIRSQCFDEDKTIEHNGKQIKIAAGRVHGYQVEIDPSDRAWSGGIYDEGRRGWLNDLKDNKEARQAFKQNEWNKYRVECKGDSIKTWINGVPAADLKDSMTPSGFISLQVHSTKKEEPMQVRWRNVRIMELK